MRVNALEVEVKMLREMLDAMRDDRNAWRDQAGKVESWRAGDESESTGACPSAPDLSLLSHEQKDALVTALMAQIAALTARVAELEAKLGLPPKTPDNSSLPPSKGQKAPAPSKPTFKVERMARARFRKNDK
ncbi:MAG TPA: hypothetical protein VKG91_10195 [Roseiarcus sp.]|nr:hypothetical protein [Roseiarcus sp.]